MFSRDFVGGIAAVFIGSLYLLFTLNLRTSSLSDSVGPAGFPKVLGILMVLLGFILCLQSIYHYFRSDKAKKFEWKGQGKVILRAFGLLCLGVGYLLLVKTLGYAISIALLLFLVTMYQGAPVSWRVAAIAGSGAVVLWAVFVLLLGVSMPSGVF